MKEIVVKIEYMRIKLGLSKRELSQRSGISEEYYWRLVTNKAPGCSFAIIDRLCSVVGLSLTLSFKEGLSVLDGFKKE